MQFQFDASQFDPTMGLQPWTDGWHDAIITATAPQPTRAGNGQGFLALTVQSATEGPHKPQIIRLNLWNANPQAVEIANKELSAIIYCTIGAAQGRLQIQNDTNELCNIPFKVLVGRQKDRPNLNEFLAYKDARGNDPKGVGGGGAPAAAPGGFGAPPAAAAPPTGFAPPQGAFPAPAGAPAAATPAWAPQQAPQAAQPAFAAPPANGAPAFGQPPAQPPMQQPQQQWGPPPAAAAPAAAAAPWQR